MDKFFGNFILPLSFGAKRRLLRAVIFFGFALTGVIIDVLFFRENLDFSLVEEAALLPKVLIIFILSFVPTKVIMFLYMKRKLYKPLRDEGDKK
ncbi:MAG: hypothetical protein LUG52_00325 [Clostridia bacterium]|nr:hypothetical protein [Clostridia bacterium]